MKNSETFYKIGFNPSPFGILNRNLTFLLGLTRACFDNFRIFTYPEDLDMELLYARHTKL